MSDVFIQALIKVGIGHDPDRMKVFTNLLDLVGQIEPYTLFTSRTILSIEEQIFGDMDYISLVLSTNMFLEALIVGEEKDIVTKQITAMLESVSPKLLGIDRQGIALTVTFDFLSQLAVKETKNVVEMVLNSWYKVIVLMTFYESDIYDLIASITSPLLRKEETK